MTFSIIFLLAIIGYQMYRIVKLKVEALAVAVMIEKFLDVVSEKIIKEEDEEN